MGALARIFHHIARRSASEARQYEARTSRRAASASGPTLPRQYVEHGEQAQRSDRDPSRASTVRR